MFALDVQAPNVSSILAGADGMHASLAGTHREDDYFYLTTVVDHLEV